MENLLKTLTILLGLSVLGGCKSSQSSSAKTAPAGGTTTTTASADYRTQLADTCGYKYFFSTGNSYATRGPKHFQCSPIGSGFSPYSNPKYKLAVYSNGKGYNARGNMSPVTGGFGNQNTWDFKSNCTIQATGNHSAYAPFTEYDLSISQINSGSLTTNSEAFNARIIDQVSGNDDLVTCVLVIYNTCNNDFCFP